MIFHQTSAGEVFGNARLTLIYNGSISVEAGRYADTIGFDLVRTDAKVQNIKMHKAQEQLGLLDNVGCSPGKCQQINVDVYHPHINVASLH